MTISASFAFIRSTSGGAKMRSGQVGVSRGRLFMMETRMNAGPVPGFVRDEVERFATCEDFEQGFLVAECRPYGEALRVPFAWKSRDTCPSCMGRRMAETAGKRYAAQQDPMVLVLGGAESPRNAARPHLRGGALLVEDNNSRAPFGVTMGVALPWAWPPMDGEFDHNKPWNATSKPRKRNED